MLKILLFTILSLTILERVFNVVEHFLSGYRQDLIVETLSGPIRGHTARTLFEENSYIAFKGIPYAQPPVKELRFRPPVPVQPWSQVRDCLNYGNHCMQKDDSQLYVIGNEDCLYLNVFTPAIKTKRLRSVMLYIHGGAWYYKYGEILPPDFLINEDVVVVSINYRLGVLGFMSLGTPEYSGNQGLKDQQLAMKWVHANIEKFGGDKNSVTLFGDSAGTMSSIYHMFAPESKGLFQRTIHISSSFDIYSIVAKPHHHAGMLQYAQRQNASVQTTDELIDHLLEDDATNFVRHFPFKFYHNVVTPTIEMENALQPLALMTPSNLVFEGPLQTDIDVLAGFSSTEWLRLVVHNATQYEPLEDLRIQLPSIHFNSAMYESTEYQLAARKIRDYYFPNATAYTKQNLEPLKSDVYQKYIVDHRIKMLAEKSTGRTYYYRFAMQSTVNYFMNLLGAGAGAVHGDDLCYVCPCNYSVKSLKAFDGLTVDSPEYGMIRIMSGLYANFAKFGNPAPSLRGYGPVRPNQYTFLNITNDGLSVGEEPIREVSRFWSQLMSDHPSLVNLWH